MQMQSLASLTAQNPRIAVVVFGDTPCTAGLGKGHGRFCVASRIMPQIAVMIGRWLGRAVLLIIRRQLLRWGVQRRARGGARGFGRIGGTASEHQRATKRLDDQRGETAHEVYEERLLLLQREAK